MLRPFNTYGPRQSARAVIPTVITQIASGRNRIKLGALTPTRDFNFVGDTVRGFVAAPTPTRRLGEVDQCRQRLRDLDRRHRAADRRADGRHRGGEPSAGSACAPGSEVERLFADNAKARDLLGWEPRVPGPDGLRRGLIETIDWFRRPANLRLYKPGATTSERQCRHRRAARRDAESVIGDAPGPSRCTSPSSPATNGTTSRSASTPAGCRRSASFVDRFERELADVRGARTRSRSSTARGAASLCLLLAGVARATRSVPTLTFVATANACAMRRGAAFRRQRGGHARRRPGEACVIPGGRPPWSRRLHQPPHRPRDPRARADARLRPSGGPRCAVGGCRRFRLSLSRTRPSRSGRTTRAATPDVGPIGAQLQRQQDHHDRRRRRDRHRRPRLRIAPNT